MKAIRIISPLLLISLMAVIFFFSSQTAEQSSGTSGRIVTFVLETVHPDFEDMDDVQKAELIERYQFIIRKSAHFSIYFLMGIFSYFTFITYTRLPFAIRFSFSNITCLAYSVSDEFHQTFISGRSGELRDICIDFAGSLLAITLFSLFFIKKFRRSDKPMRKSELFSINEQLVSKNRELISEKEKLNDEIKALREEISKLKAENEALLESKSPTLPLQKLENKVTSQAEISDDTKYGSKIIGQIVVSAARYCNSLTNGSNREITKEQVNLILGRTEVAKAEILKELSKDISFEEKKSAIDFQQKSAEDYFKSVSAQTE